MITLHEFLATYQEDYQLSPTKEGARKARQHIQKLDELVGDRPIDELSEVDLRRAVKRRSEEVQASTVNLQISHWKRVLQEAVDQGLIRATVLRGLKRLKRPSDSYRKSLLAEELQRLIACIRPRSRAWYAAHIALYTGMRRSEILTLELSRIDLSRGRLTVAPVPDIAFYPKGKRVRGLIIHRELRPILEDCIEKYGDGRRFLLVAVSGERYDHLEPCNELDTMMRRAMRQAGLTGTWHRLRHTFADYFMDQEGEIRSLQALLGHQEVRTTEVYLTQAPDRRAATELSRMKLPLTAPSRQLSLLESPIAVA